jgi:hypothetical protein
LVVALPPAPVLSEGVAGAEARSFVHK